MSDNAKTIREDIERYRRLMEFNTDASVKKLLDDLLKDAKAELKKLEEKVSVHAD